MLAAAPMAAVPRVHLADPQANIREIVELLRQADAQNVRLCVFPELCLCGYHVMLMDLKQQVKVGDEVPLTLTIENKDGSRATIELKAAARPLNAPMKMHH